VPLTGTECQAGTAGTLAERAEASATLSDHALSFPAMYGER
jgi:hypothetical protein